MSIKTGSLWKFHNENSIWKVKRQSLNKIILSGIKPYKFRSVTEEFLCNNAIEVASINASTDNSQLVPFPKKYFSMIGKISDTSLAKLISEETGTNVNAQKVRYWRKRKGIEKFSVIENIEKIKMIKNYIEQNPNFTINNLKTDLGVYMINGKPITWNLIVNFAKKWDPIEKDKVCADQPFMIKEFYDVATSTKRRVISVNNSSSKQIIKHGYGNPGARCKCEMCKLTRSIYQKYYSDFRNPMKIKCCEALAFLYIETYKQMTSQEFYMFLDSIVTPDMFKYPQKA